MATKSMAYDHPAYLQRYTGGGITTAGNAAVSNQFAAFTTMKAKSAQITQRVAGTTAGHSITVSVVSGTATTSLAAATMGTSAIGVTTNITLGNTALAQGDVLVCKNGTDATGSCAVTYELAATNGANVT